MPRAQGGGLPPPLRLYGQPLSPGRVAGPVSVGPPSIPLPRLENEQEAVGATELVLAGEILGKAVPTASRMSQSHCCCGFSPPPLASWTTTGGLCSRRNPTPFAESHFFTVPERKSAH